MTVIPVIPQSLIWELMSLHGIPADKISPAIVYSPLLNTNSTTVRSLIVSVTDPGSGVPATAPGWPNLYWKKNTGGSWTAVTPSGVAGSIYHL